MIPPTGMDYGHQLFSDEVLSATNRASLNGRYNRQVEMLNAKFTHKMPHEKDEIMGYPYFYKIKMNNLNFNQHKVGGFVKPKRALSIISSKPKDADHEKMTVTSIVKQKDFFHGSSMSLLTSPTNDANRPLSQKPTARAKSTQKVQPGVMQN